MNLLTSNEPRLPMEASEALRSRRPSRLWGPARYAAPAKAVERDQRTSERDQTRTEVNGCHLGRASFATPWSWAALCDTRTEQMFVSWPRLSRGCVAARATSAESSLGQDLSPLSSTARNPLVTRRVPWPVRPGGGREAAIFFAGGGGGSRTLGTRLMRPLGMRLRDSQVEARLCSRSPGPAQQSLDHCPLARSAVPGPTLISLSGLLPAVPCLR